MLTVNRFPQIIAGLTPKVDAALGVGAQVIAVDAAQRVPVGDPKVHLKDRIRAERLGRCEWAVIAGDENDVFYGHMVEHGTTHSAPHPFLVPAAEANGTRVLGLVTGALRRL